jgi:hypothetical protein
MVDERVDAKLIKSLVQKSALPLADPLWESWAAGEPYRRFLHWLCREVALPSLELGVDGGQTSALMAAAGVLVIGVDSRGLNKTSPPFRYPNFRFLFCDSLGAKPGVEKVLNGQRLGVVFQDSSHHAEPSRLEWEYYKGLLAPGAVWVCDDVTESFRMPDEPLGMMGYFNALPGHKLTFPGLHVGNVIGVVLT